MREHVPDEGAPLHRPGTARAAASQLTAFARLAEARSGRTFSGFPALHRFSVEEFRLFWRLLLEFAAVRYDGDPAPACLGGEVETARFFPALRLSWPEHLLAPRPGAEDGAIAIVGLDETFARTELTWGELRRRVRAVAAALAARGLREGDRVVAVARHAPETIVAALAVTSLGASWSSVAPEMGYEAALSRFGQLAPRLLLVHGGGGAHGARVTAHLSELLRALGTVELVVELGEGRPMHPAAPGGQEGDRATPTLSDLAREGACLPGADPAAPLRRFAFDHPLFILFSSGTTGAPKCIVHGHGGTLLEHLKEHHLHLDLRPPDRLLFHTTTGWMMWNWLVSALGTGTRLVLYDGSVTYLRRDALLRAVAQEGVTVFGTSPAYLQFLVDNEVEPAPGSLAAVRELESTGSVLYPHLHRWAKAHLADVPLQSISGGTDILGCFVQGNPWSDVHAGESAGLGLGLDVRVATSAGIQPTGRGELVCCTPFPSRPVGLFGDARGERFHRAYFAQHEGVWTHGDEVLLTERGSARILGRCDGILNIRGIRFGPGEIYDVLAAQVPEVAEAMAVDQEAPAEPGGRRLVLLLVLKPGLTLDHALSLKVKRELKNRASSVHVPAVLLQVEELPTTHSGKRSEAALQDLLSGRPVRNVSALKNPGCLAAIAARPELGLAVGRAGPQAEAQAPT